MSCRRPFLIVSLDGGGVRSAIQVELLRRLFEQFPSLESRVDMYAGTSAGAILASAIAMKGFAKARECATQQQFAHIFGNTWSHSLHSVDGFYRARFNNQNLNDFLTNFFGSTTGMKEVNEKRLLVTAFRLAGEEKKEKEEGKGSPVIYHNLDNEAKEERLTLVDMLLQSSAAPTYFPSHLGCVDGGVMANNPSLLAMSYAVRYGYCSSFDDIVLLSLGTGQFIDSPPSLQKGHIERDEQGDLGVGEWLPYYASLMMDANSAATSIIANQLLQNSLHLRVQPVLQEAIDLCDYNKVPNLIQVATTYPLEDVFQSLQRHFNFNLPAAGAEKEAKEEKREKEKEAKVGTEAKEKEANEKKQERTYASCTIM